MHRAVAVGGVVESGRGLRGHRESAAVALQLLLPASGARSKGYGRLEVGAERTTRIVRKDRRGRAVATWREVVAWWVLSSVWRAGIGGVRVHGEAVSGRVCHSKRRGAATAIVGRAKV